MVGGTLRWTCRPLSYVRQQLPLMQRVLQVVSPGIRAGRAGQGLLDSELCATRAR